MNFHVYYKDIDEGEVVKVRLVNKKSLYKFPEEVVVPMRRKSFVVEDLEMSGKVQEASEMCRKRPLGGKTMRFQRNLKKNLGKDIEKRLGGVVNGVSQITGNYVNYLSKF